MTEPTATDLTSPLADGTAAGNWVLDPAGSHAGFAVKQFWGAITVRGTFERMTGEAAVGPEGTVTGRIRRPIAQHQEQAARQAPTLSRLLRRRQPPGRRPDSDLSTLGRSSRAAMPGNTRSGRPRPAGHLQCAYPGGEPAGRRADRRIRGRPQRVRHDVEPHAYGVDDRAWHGAGPLHPRLNTPGDRRPPLAQYRARPAVAERGTRAVAGFSRSPTPLAGIEHQP
jgi:hypothetical protein